MGWEDSVDHEVDRLAVATDFNQSVAQVDLVGAAHLETAEMDAEVDNEIDRLITEAGSDSENTLNSNTFRSPTTAGVGFDPLSRTRGAGVEPNAGLRPSNLADTSISLGSQIAARPNLGSMGVTGATGSSSTVDASLRYLKSLPIVPVSDLPNELNSCPICKEAYEDTEELEVPVRLPCGHLFGSLCISIWISKNTCPLCRAVLRRPNAAIALAQDAEAREPSIPISPVLLRAPQTPNPLVFEYSDVPEENLRRLDVRFLELADERRWLLELRAFRRAQEERVSIPSSSDSLVAQIEICLLSNMALTRTLREEQTRYRLEI